MDLIETLRSTAAIRDFEAAEVTDEELRRILDTARFAPNGGNAQSWHVVVVKDAPKRRALRDIYCEGWRLYLAQRAAGLRPWAPITDRALERESIASASPSMPLGDFADKLDQVPAMLVLLADLRLLAAVDRDLDRYSFIGGASVYPFAWSLLLAARAEGIGGVITTMPVFREAEVKSLLAAPEEFAVAALIALGRPTFQPTRLRRRPVDDFTTVDSFNGRSI